MRVGQIILDVTIYEGDYLLWTEYLQKKNMTFPQNNDIRKSCLKGYILIN